MHFAPRILGYFILLFVVLSPELSHSQTNGDIKVSVFSINGESRAAIAADVQAKWSWEKVSNGVEAVKAKIIFNLPDSIQIKEANSPSSSADIKFKGQKVLLVTGDLNTFINIDQTNGQSSKLLVKIQSTNWPRWVTGCNEAGLQFKTNVPVLPFFVGVRCVNEGSIARLHLSFPEEIQIEKSNLTESAGKGESWRSYDLGNLDAAQGLIAKLQVRFQKQSFVLGLASSKVQAPVKKPAESKFALGLGYDMMKFDSLTTSVSDANPLFIAKALPYRLFWIVGVGIDLETTLSMKQSEQTISFFQVSPYAQARLLSFDSFTLDPRVYYTVTRQSHAFTSANVQFNQVGVGFKTSFQLTDGLLGQFEFRTDSLGSQVVKSHSLIDLSARQKPANGNTANISFGGGFQMQKLTVVDPISSSQYDFSNMAVYGLVIF